jgi:hypothetical protein
MGGLYKLATNTRYVLCLDVLCCAVHRQVVFEGSANIEGTVVGVQMTRTLLVGCVIGFGSEF